MAWQRDVKVYSTHELAVSLPNPALTNVLFAASASDAASTHEGDHYQNDEYADPDQRV